MSGVRGSLRKTRRRNERRKEVEDVASGWFVSMEVAYLDAN